MHSLPPTTTFRSRPLAFWIAVLACGASTGAQAQTALAMTGDADRGSPSTTAMQENPVETSEQRWNLHFQTTYVGQHKNPFSAPYSGPQSLIPSTENGYTWTATVFFGLRLWQGAEFYVNPEVVVGDPFSHLFGLASIQNGEIQKNGGTKPKGYWARAFLRQTFDLGGETVRAEDDANQLASNYQTRRVVLTLGKVTQTDLFEKSSYANDPRIQFLNWALITHGAWDYAADARAYTIGAAGEFYWDEWAFRAGRYMEPQVANGSKLNYNLERYHGDVVEVQHDHTLNGLPGLVRVLAFRNRTFAGNYLDAIEAAKQTGTTPDVTSVRKDAAKIGYGVSFEQRLSDDIGVFARGSSANDRIEEYAFTEIDNALSAGVAIKGTRWQRPEDVFGVAVSTAGLNRQHRAYLAAGGLGGFLGDGQLKHYARENILEAYYNYQVLKGVQISPDFQIIDNPGYNADRHGPVYIFGVRFHVGI